MTKDQVVILGASPALRAHLATALAVCALVHQKSVVAVEPKGIQEWAFMGNTGKQKAQWKQETYGRKRK